MLRIDVSDVLFRMGTPSKIGININVLLKQTRYGIVLFTWVSSGNCIESLSVVSKMPPFSAYVLSLSLLLL